VVHLHGIESGGDHRALCHLPREVLELLFACLSRRESPERVVTLEVFGELDLRDSLNVLEKMAHE
jgi:hypothetical protein